MPEFLSRLWEWFKARSNAQQAFIIAGVVIVLGAASRVMAFIAGLVFLAALTGLTVQLVRRRPVRIWAIAAGGSLVLEHRGGS